MEFFPFLIFTVGHSSHSWGDFLSLLQAHDVTKIIDVRSRPMSRFAHFNRPELTRRLGDAGIAYRFSGDVLGGRPAHGAADYEAMATAVAYRAGVTDVVCEAVEDRLALMCSEHDPLMCHRCLLVARSLSAFRDAPVLHILRDGTLETQQEAEDRLLRLTRQTDADLFGTREQRLAIAYRMQNHRLWGIHRRSGGGAGKSRR